MFEALPVFLPIELRDGEAPTALSMVASEGGSSGRLEIVLAGGNRLSVRGAFDGEAVARFLAVLMRSWPRFRRSPGSGWRPG